MELSHRFVVPASLDVTWTAFNDLASVAPCFPGATITSIEGDDFVGSVKVKLGPIAMLYNGTGRFVERDEANHRAVIEAKGKDKRGNGTAGATIVALLTADGTGTAVEVTTDLAITGKPAQFGRGVMQDVSDKLLGLFVDCIAGKLGSVGESPAASAPAEPAAATDPVATSAPASAPPLRAAPEPVEAPDINLMSAVLPVLLKRYGLPIAGLIAIALAIWAWAKD